MADPSSVRSRLWTLAVVVVLAVVLAVRVGGQSIASRFVASLRIERPKTVSVSVAAPAGGGRQLLGAVAGILAESTSVATDDSDSAVPTLDAAARAASFRPRVLRGRSDAPVIYVTGAHSVTARVNRDQFRTLLVEAGRASTVVPASVDGQSITVTVPRGVRLQYGRCPAPVSNTLQAQINGPPPPSTDNGNCVMLTETPVSAATLPPALDSAAVLEIALELAGMSPNQVRDFRQLFDWRAAMTMSPPRFMRSYDVVDLGAERALLMITGGRRGPTYELTWVDSGIVYTMTGYGSSADAAPLAKSVSAA